MQNQPFHGLKFNGITYDCGDKIGFLSANVAFALEHETLGPAFRAALEQTIATHGGFLSWGKSPGLTDVLAMLQESDSPTEVVEKSLPKTA